MFEALELKLQIFESCHLVVENKTECSARTVIMPNLKTTIPVAEDKYSNSKFETMPQKLIKINENLK